MCSVNYIPFRFMTEGLVTPTARRSRMHAIRALRSAYTTPIIPRIILIPRGTYYSQNYSRKINTGIAGGGGGGNWVYTQSGSILTVCLSFFSSEIPEKISIFWIHFTLATYPSSLGPSLPPELGHNMQIQ